MIGVMLIKTPAEHNIPVMTVFVFMWSLIEYFIHRYLLHGEIPSHQNAEHSAHHGYFTREFMKVEKGLDANSVLLIPIDLMSVVALNSFLSYGISIFTNENMALLFFLSGTLYVIAYEILHAVCHLPIETKSPLVKALVRHHKIHHDKIWMKRKNFAVVFPFMDSFFGTKR